MTLAVVGLIALFTVSAPAAETLKWAHVYEVSESLHTEALWAADEIARRTDGRYKTEVYPASQLGKEADLNQGLTLGTVDIILSGNGFAARAYPKIGVTSYPYTFRDVDHLLAYTHSETYRKLAAGYEAATGHHIAATAYFGTRQTTSNRAFATCAEMAGLKIRVPDVPAYLAMPRACGANPAPIAFAEVYLALQNGTVDAAESPLPTIEAKKFYEVQKYLVLTGHIAEQVNAVVSGSRWKTLSDADKAIFTEVLEQWAGRVGRQIATRETELLPFFKDKGLTIIDVDRGAFEKAVLAKVPFAEFGYDEADWQAIKALR